MAVGAVVAVLAEGLTVVGGDRDQCLARDGELVERVEHAPEELVQVADLGVVAAHVLGEPALALQHLVRGQLAVARVRLPGLQHDVGRRGRAGELVREPIERGGRRVRPVRVLEVHPQEEALAGELAEPPHGRPRRAFGDLLARGVAPTSASGKRSS